MLDGITWIVFILLGGIMTRYLRENRRLRAEVADLQQKLFEAEAVALKLEADQSAAMEKRLNDLCYATEDLMRKELMAAGWCVYDSRAPQRWTDGAKIGGYPCTVLYLDQAFNTMRSRKASADLPQNGNHGS